MVGMQSAEHSTPQHRSTGFYRVAVCGALFAVYLAFVLTATMWPTPLDTDYGDAITRLLGVLHRHGVPEWFGYRKLEFTANAGMFVPLGFLMALLPPRRWWWLALLWIPALSISIELVQWTLLSERFGSGVDVVANTIGGYLGALAAVGLRSLVHARDRAVIRRFSQAQQRGRSSRMGSANHGVARDAL